MRKYAFCFIFAMCLLIFTSGTRAATILIDPATQDSPASGGTITISVRIEDVINLAGYEFELVFDETTVKYSSIEEDDFLKTGGTTTFFIPRTDMTSDGLLKVANTGIPPKGVDGSGRLATITFEVLEAESSILELRNVKLKTADLETINANVVSGAITVPHEMPGIITTIAGTGEAGFSGDGGDALLASLNRPYGIFVDPEGDLFIADRYNNRIRRVDGATGIITTVAGTGVAGFSGDEGEAAHASLNEPASVFVDSEGNLFIADRYNHRVRRVDGETRIITTVAGTGTAGFSGDGGRATQARLHEPIGVFVDLEGDLFIADYVNHCIRRVDSQTGIVSTVAGTGMAGFSGDRGQAIQADLNDPVGIFVDSEGNLFIADAANHRVRRVNGKTGIIDTVAGNGAAGFSGDGVDATRASLYQPVSVFVDSDGDLFIAEWANCCVRRVDGRTGIMSIVAGTGEERFSGDGGQATQASLQYPFAVFVDSAGDLLIADALNHRIRRVEGIAAPTTLGGVVSPDARRILSITSPDASPGTYVTVELSINEATGVAGADILVEYDTDVITVSEVKGTDLISNMTLIANKDVPGEIKLEMAGTQGISSGRGALVKIELLISSDAQVGTQTTLKFGDTRIYNESVTVIPVDLANGVVRIIEPVGIRGDVNSDGGIYADDAILALRIAAGLMAATGYQRWAADMNGDGQVGADDAILILRKAGGLAAPSIGILASAGSRITVTLTEANGVAGESVTVPLKVDNTAGLAGGDICVAYDSAVLRAVDVSSDSQILLASNTSEPGMVRIAFADADKLNTKALAEIQFDILADAVSPLTLQKVELYQPDALPIGTRKINGQFSSWAIPPERSALLQNFPNPFNPDTWIPYQLSEPSDVSITIYDSTGRVVKRLDLGHKSAGIYRTQDRAAHWSGHNDAGETVASGVYFVVFDTRYYHQTQRIVLIR